MRPVIGITAYEEQARWGSLEIPAVLAPLVYVEAVERAGGRPLLVPPSAEGAEETVGALDGLVLSGGSDVDPATYGADPHPETRNVRPDRDRAELALVRAALARDLPVLAVCRGMQVFNVAHGGDLVQHLPDVVGHPNHRRVRGVFDDHDVTVRAGSRLAAVLGERAPVKSHHHQAPGRLGAGLVEVAWAEDGTVEGIEDPARRFALGVLWHPEQGDDLSLFRALVAEAGAYRAAKTGA